MTPEQITIVEQTLRRAQTDLVALAADFYERLFVAEPQLRELFTSDPTEQRRKFAQQLAAIGWAIRDFDAFVERVEELGMRHRHHGVRDTDYARAGPPLLAALAALLGEEWTDDLHDAWRRAYNLIVEAITAAAAAP